LLVLSTALAQDSDIAPTRKTVVRTAPPSPNATVNLVNLLVKHGVLTQEQADELIKQAEDEAYVARQAARDAATKAQEAGKTAEAAAAAASPPGTKRVTYVPEIVKREMREQLRKEVLAQAKAEKWAAPNTFPEWVSRIRFYGDIRGRYEGQFFPAGNDNSGNLVNFNAINTGNPVAPNVALLPVRDVDTDRNRFRLRARLGLEANLFDGFTAGLRIATGDSSSPVSTTATLGGGGGNFNKYPVWLDRGWIKYTTWEETLTASVGRFDNPFFAPTDLVWYSELGFDGAALQLKSEILPGITPFVVGGAFPLYNTPLNYPSTGAGQFGTGQNIGANQGSTDKYLFGVQGGLAWRIDENVSLRIGAAFYDFNNVRGALSSPCDVIAATSICDTDLRRPLFAQYGNTYMGLRNIVPNLVAFSPPAIQPLFQYYGLASDFRVVDVTGRLDLGYFSPVHVILDGAWVRNVAFNRKDLEAIAVNNRGPSPDGVNPGAFEGGNTGAMARLIVGYPNVRQLWDWNVFVAYKYLESDTVIDAFTDPDFGLGGTNLKGYIVGANLGLGPNVWATAKWMSANAIAGSPFAVDILQLDVNARF
jgi:hypothetical protein